LTILLLISCKNSEKPEAENHSEYENEITQSEFKKVETNNSLELEFQILNENDERVEFASLEKIAEFPGGFDSLAVFIQRNFVFPKSTDSLTVKGLSCLTTQLIIHKPVVRHLRKTEIEQ